MTEVIRTLEDKMLDRESEVRRLEDQTTILPEAVYKKGFEERVAVFGDIFKDIPLSAGFSWGDESGTMSFKWKGESEKEEDVKQRITDFLGALNIDYPGVVHMLGVLEGTHPQIQVVDSFDLIEGEDETPVNANFVYTTDPNLPIVIRPADCPVSVIYARTREMKRFVGVAHSSGVSTNAGIPRMVPRYMREVENIDVSTVRIGMTPGIGRTYSISEDATQIVERNWKRHIDPEPDGNGRRHVDIMRATIMQYIEGGINPMQIDAYGLDTYEAHQKGTSFSHRFYEEQKEAGEPVVPGRFMVAVQLQEVAKIPEI